MNGDDAIPEYPPISLHLGDALSYHKSAQGAYILDVLSPMGYHSGASHLPLPPVNHQYYQKFKMCAE